MSPWVTAFFDKATGTASYVLADKPGGRCAVIDPVLGYDPKSGRTGTVLADRIIAFTRDSGLTVDWLLETHIHADHLTAAAYLKRQAGGRAALGEHVTIAQRHFKPLFHAVDLIPDGSQFDHLFADGGSFRIGGLDVHTPGHSPDGVSYIAGNAVFVGDTLFMPDAGTARCDFPGGSPEALYGSVRRLLDLPPSTRMFVCHDYGANGRRAAAWETTVAEQRVHNIHMHDGVACADFVALRKERDAGLELPVLILPSIQVNMRAGNFPPPDENGVSYLRIPLNVL